MRETNNTNANNSKYLTRSVWWSYSHYFSEFRFNLNNGYPKSCFRLSWFRLLVFIFVIVKNDTSEKDVNPNGSIESVVLGTKSENYFSI